MEDEGGVAPAGVQTGHLDGSHSTVVRLTDIPSPTNFSGRFQFLSPIDAISKQVVFNWKSARATLGFTHLVPLILAFTALVLGSWDLGSGELSGGGTTIEGGSSAPTVVS